MPWQRAHLLLRCSECFPAVGCLDRSFRPGNQISVSRALPFSWIQAQVEVMVLRLLTAGLLVTQKSSLVVLLCQKVGLPS